MEFEMSELQLAWFKSWLLCDEGDKLIGEVNKLCNEGRKLCTEGNKLWDEGWKLIWDEGWKLRNEGDKLWEDKVHKIKGRDTEIDWKDDNTCILNNTEVFEKPAEIQLIVFKEWLKVNDPKFCKKWGVK